MCPGAHLADALTSTNANRLLHSPRKSISDPGQIYFAGIQAASKNTL